MVIRGPIGCTVDFRDRLLHLEIILLKKPSRIALCNKALAERKLKVVDLVRSTGINKSTLHKLYNDESVRIDFETIDKICIALDVEVGDLLIFKKIDNNQNDNGWFGHKWSHQKVKWSQIIE